MLSHVIHDWKKDQCLTILGNCRRANEAGAKLLIVKFVLPEGSTPHFGKLLETEGNRIRTLLARAGLK